MKKQHIASLPAANARWAEKFGRDNPVIFDELAAQQNPAYLWIGCSDSRIPANQVMGLLPGEVFVHRNVGNIVHAMDINCHSVIQYAVDELQVSDIIVGGHYDCGAVKAALSMKDYGMLNNWLSSIKDIYNGNRANFALADEQGKIDRLCELNVIEQVKNVCKSNEVQRAWARGQQLFVHGLIYSVHDGRLRDLNCSVDSNESLEEIYRFKH